MIETAPLEHVDHERASTRAEVKCPGCIAQIQRAEAILEDLHNAELRCRALERRVKTLEADKPKATRPKKNDDQTLRRHVMYPAAQEVFSWWKAQCHPKAREFSGKRLRNTIDRLEGGYTVKELKLACYGAARHPNVMDGTVYNDLELIARDPSKTDNFMGRGRLALAEDKAAGLAPAESKAEHDERRRDST